MIIKTKFLSHFFAHCLFCRSVKCFPLSVSADGWAADEVETYLSCHCPILATLFIPPPASDMW